MLVLLASSNAGKLAELQELFRGSPLELELPGRASFTMPAVDETGASFADNALIKARALAEVSGNWALADDSGLEVDALKGEPGIRSARYAGPQASDEDNVRRLLSTIGIGKQRSARFVCVLALARPQGETLLAEGVLEGEIARSRRGTGGFGYDPVFLLPDLGKTLAELSFEEKQRLSHRARAAARMKELLSRL